MNKYIILIAIFVFFSGCGHDHSSHDHSSICDDSVDTVPFEPAMKLTSTDQQFTLEVGTTNPDPIDRGNNTWTVTLTDSSGSPVDGATIVLEPTMPGHGHGTSPATFQSTNTDAGLYEIGPFNLMMPGTWLMTFTITTPDNTTSTIEVAYCIES